jgi:antirestriction protein ArdC
VKDIHEVITERFIQALEQGTVPWRKPWKQGGNPRNLVSNHNYQGINFFMLYLSNHASPYWLTFRQAHELGGSVRAGAESTPIIYYKLHAKTEANGQPVFTASGKPEMRPFLRYSNVFNLDQTQNVKLPRHAQEQLQEKAKPIAIPTAEEMLSEIKPRICPIRHEGYQPYYNRNEDFIAVPTMEKFHTSEAYYQALFHEAAHATGHHSRLNRTFGEKFGDPQYAKEELVAEMTASFLAHRCDILNERQFENSAGYVGGWIKKLREDKTLVITASSQAHRAFNYTLGLEPHYAETLPSEVEKPQFHDPLPIAARQGPRRGR